MAPQSDDTPLADQLKETRGLLFKHFAINQNGGSVQHLDTSKVLNSDCPSMDTASVVKKYVNVAERTYLQLCDFDDHFADIKKCDWRNAHIR